MQDSTDHEEDEQQVASETSITRWPYFPVALGAILTLIVSSVIVLSQVEFIKSRPTFLYLSEHRLLYDDWTSRPFVQIKVVTSGEDCGDADYEPIFTRMWNGTHPVCKLDPSSLSDNESNFAMKSKLKSSPISSGGQNFKYELLTSSDSPCEGQKIEPIAAVNMTKQADGSLICAKRGGRSFLDAVRIDPRVEVCPDDLLACVSDINAYQTQCVHELDECPILDV